MSNFLALYDANPGRSQSYLQRIRKQCPAPGSLVWEDAQKGNFRLLYAAPSAIPVEVHRGGNSLTLKIGHCFDPESGSALGSADLRDRLPGGAAMDQSPGALDGYHMWLSLSPDYGLRASGDLLGAMPLYYWGNSEVVVIASSAALIAEFDACPQEVDVCGLLGILMTNGLVDGRTPWEGIRRLDAGAILEWQRGGLGCREHRRVFGVHPELVKEVVAAGAEHFTGRSFAELERVIGQQFGELGGTSSVLLSGGLDSRTCAAIALRLGIPLADGITFGRRDDYEAQCASLVAAELGLPHRVIDANDSALAIGLDFELDWGGLVGGASNAAWHWHAAQQIGDSCDNLLTGFALDSLLAPRKRKSTEPEPLDQISDIYGKIRAWGIPDDPLEEMLSSSDWIDGIAWVEDRVKDRLRELAAADLPVLWSDQLFRRVRFHIGSFAWTLAQGCFPYIPIYDRRFIELIGAAPPSWSEGRVTQNRMLVENFPALATIPLDINAKPDGYLLEPSKDAIERHQKLLGAGPRELAFKIRSACARALRRPTPRPPERRYYYRVYGYPHHDGWQEARTRALDVVEHTPGLDPTAVDRFFALKKPVDFAGEGASRKNLIGALLWADRYRPIWPGGSADLPAPSAEYDWTVGPAVTEVLDSGFRVEIPISATPLSTSVFFQVDQVTENEPSGDDVCLPVALIPAMAGRVRELSFPAGLSQQQLAGEDSIQELFHGWFPDFHKVPIKASSRPGGSRFPSGRRTAAFFTGGVDSCHTAISEREEIDVLIYVHGFDIGLDDPEHLELSLGRIRAMGAALGKPVILVTTDLRTFSDRYCRWGHHYFGAGLASVALLLAPWIERVYISASYDEKTLQPLGSHPELDPLWSTGEVEIIHHGLEASRLERVCTLRAVPELLPNLRVCYHNNPGAYNCGQCEKCLRTLLHLEIAGLADHPGLPFPARLEPADVAGLKNGADDLELTLRLWAESLPAMRKAAVSPDLIAAVEQLVST